MSEPPYLADDIHAQPSFKDEDSSLPTSEDKNAAPNTEVTKGLSEIKQKGSEFVLDHHKFPKAHKVDEGRSSESTAGDPAPAGQVNVPTVEQKPRTSKEAEPDPGDQQVDIGADTKDVVVETNIVIIADTLMQVLKNQVPREAEIHDLEEVMKSQPLAKESSEPPLKQALPLPISIEIHAMIFIDLQAAAAELPWPLVINDTSLSNWPWMVLNQRFHTLHSGTPLARAT